MEDLEKAARQQGISFEDFKAQIRDQILTQQVVRDEVGRHLSVTSAEEQKYYSEHAEEFEQPEQVRLSEILVPLPDTATPAEIVQAERKANDLKSQVMKGSDFAEVAKKSSGGPDGCAGRRAGAVQARRACQSARGSGLRAEAGGEHAAHSNAAGVCNPQADRTCGGWTRASEDG